MTQRWCAIRRALGVRTVSQASAVPPSVRFRTLADELSLELVEELKSQLVLRRQSLLTDNSLHGRGITANGVLRILQHDGENGLDRVKPIRLTSWFETSPWSFLVSFSPIALFINRESDGRTLMGG